MSSNNVSLLSIPRICPERLKIENVVLGTQHILKWGTNEAYWEFQWAADAGFLKPQHVLIFKVRETEYALGLESWPSLSLADIHLDAQSIEALPKEISILYLEAALENILTALEKKYSTSIQLIHTQRTWPYECDRDCMRLHWKLKSSQQDLIVQGLVDLEFKHLQNLKLHLDQLETVDVTALTQALKWDARLNIGSVVLSATDFKTLNLSDVIIFDEHAKLRQGILEVKVDSIIIYEAKLQDNIITLRTMSENSDNINTNSESNCESKIQSLPVTLSFEVGRRRLTLKEIKALAPGFTFEFQDNPLDRPITIIANGVAVGSGELVQVGDVLGVRVVSWNAPDVDSNTPS